MALPPDKEELKKFNHPPVTIPMITAKLREFFVLVDEGIVELVISTFISNRLSTVNSPVWLLLVAESSGGKTEIIDMFSKLSQDQYKLAYHISDMSPQTFISGMNNSTKETSLLHKINGRMIFIKDFTTLLQKNKEARREILSQFREIYDGEFNKDFGTGKSVHWKGRIGVIAGLTPPAMEMMSQYAGMGERFVAYYMDQPSDAQLSEAMKENYGKDIKKIKDELSDMVAEYVSVHVALAEESNIKDQELTEEIMDELNTVAQFATRARSHVPLDFKTGEPIGMPSIERFPRFVIQLQNVAKGYCVMNGKAMLTQRQKETLYKIALDSIPRTRRACLHIVSGYRAVSSSAVAAKLGLTTPVTRGFLAQLASLMLIQRIPGGGKGNEDAWRLLKKYVEFMKKFEKITAKDEDMFEEDEVDIEDTLAQSEEEKADMTNELADSRDTSAIRKIARQNGISFTEAKEVRDSGEKTVKESGDEDW